MPAATGESREDARSALRERVRALDPWYHTLDLGDGVVTEGMFDLRPYVTAYGLPDVAGKRVLDVGTFDGFWAFELERRGAIVTSLDLDRIQQLDWPPRLRPPEDAPRGDTFRVARDALGSAAERVGCSIYEATPERLGGGAFDLVFCGSVLIHLRDPMLALERMAGLCAGQLILAEEHSRRLAPFPFVRGAEFRGDSPWSTWWIPTAATWLRMVHAAGFEDVRRHGRFNMRFRAQRGGVPHVVVHARGTAT